ncbi:MAG: helix-turn-helix domain-containing protein [Terriglobia bacterium]
MNIIEASDYLGVSRETLYKYVAQERIPAFKLGNRWKFKKTILDLWMERQSVPDSAGMRKKKAGAR